jgi:membrane protein DedA with SNARE-associated domain
MIVHALAVYLTVALVVGVENIGVPLPGQVVLVVAAVSSSQVNDLSPGWTACYAAAGACAGGTVGYAVGRSAGARLLVWAGRWVPAYFGPAHIVRASAAFRQGRVRTVLFGRFVALLRILGAPFAGALRMPCGVFLAANAGGSVVWAVIMTMTWYWFGRLAGAWLPWQWWVLLIGGTLTVLIFTSVRSRAGRPR